MKKYLLVFVLMTMFFSCEKFDGGPETIALSCEEDDGVLKPNTFRVKQTINFQNDVETGKTVFSYEGERLSEIVVYRKSEPGAYIDSVKTVFEYNADNATSILYSKHEGDWLEVEKNIYVIKNKKVIEHSNFRYEKMEWVLEWKWVYEYSRSDLVGWHSYDEDMELEYKGAYIYKNGKVVEAQGFYMIDSDWVKVSIDSVFYKGNKFDICDYYRLIEDNWIQSSKCGYTYTGEHVSGMYWYQQDSESGAWETIVFFREYKYDNNGYLIEQMDFYGMKDKIEYEEGRGNAGLFVSAPIGVVYGRPYLR